MKSSPDVELLCPSCQTPLQAFWGRKRQRFTIYHSTRSCPHRFDTFGADEDEQKAWAIARKTIEKLNEETKTEQSSTETIRNPNRDVLPESEH